MNKPGFNKKPIFVPKKRSAPRPISSTTTTTISVEALVEENEDENDLIEHPPSCPWFATSKAVVWINFVFTLVLFMAFLIYVLTRPSTPSSSSLMEKSIETTRGDTQGGMKTFNLVSHPETTISLKTLNLSISLLKRIWVCCTKDNIYSCNGWDVKIHLETLEAKVTFKHSDKIGAACVLYWI
jgi:hypothetical protein